MTEGQAPCMQSIKQSCIQFRERVLPKSTSRQKFTPPSTYVTQHSSILFQQHYFQNQSTRENAKQQYTVKTYSFPTIWVQERGNLGVESWNWSRLSCYLSSKLFCNQVDNLGTFVYIISSNSNLGLINKY